jgi:hypothetical protein
MLVVMKTGPEYDVASSLGEDPMLVSAEGQEVGLVVALQVREIAAVERLRHSDLDRIKSAPCRAGAK